MGEKIKLLRITILLKCVAQGVLHFPYKATEVTCFA